MTDNTNSLTEKKDTNLRGSRLLLGRLAWLVIAVFTLGIFVFSLPSFMIALFSRVPEAERSVAQLGLPDLFFDFYVVEVLALSLVVMLVFLATALVVFWRRSNDWMAILVSVALVTFGAATLPPIQTAGAAQVTLRWPADLVRALGYGSFLILLYLFPDGRLIPRWTRPAALIWGIWIALWIPVPSLNPFNWPNTVALPVLMVWLGSGLVAQIYRHKRISDPAEQQQTKWAVFGLATPFLAWVVAFLPAVIIPLFMEEPGALFALYSLIGEQLVTISLLLVPLTIAMSVFRVRLWDIDLLINRALVYGGLTGALGVFYVASVVALQQIFRTLTGQTSDLAIVYSTLAMAVLFMPLRRRLQDFIDRRFYRRRYDAAQTLAAFSEKVRDEVDLNRLVDDLLAVVRETMEPAHASIWLHQAPASSPVDASEVDAEIRQASTSPVEIAPDDPLIPYVREVADVVNLERLELDSAALRALKKAGVAIVVPLVSQSELVGLLNLGPRLSRQEFSADDRRLLSNLATQAAPAVRVAQLVRQQQAEVRARERLEQELRVARLIQQTLLPADVPSLAGWELATYYQPARAVGGDFYDFLPLSDGRLGLIVGDVADKGMPAALMMASARSFLRAAARRAASPGQVLEEVNDLLCPDMPHNMFVTCLYAILDPASGRLEYANAGQTLPYRRVNGHVAELEATGLPLGVVPDAHYEENTVKLELGESLLFYSDGLVEAHNPQRQMFSFPRLETLVASHPGGVALIDFLLTELADFTGTDWEQEDDVTMLALHRSSK